MNYCSFNGDDLETENFLNLQNIKYTKSSINIGLCSGVNLASKKTTAEYIVYAHDDMYFLPNGFLSKGRNK